MSARIKVAACPNSRILLKYINEVQYGSRNISSATEIDFADWSKAEITLTCAVACDGKADAKMPV